MKPFHTIAVPTGHIIDVDSILSLEEEARLDKSLEEHGKGKSIRLEDFGDFEKKTVAAIYRYEKGRFREITDKDFLKELEKW